MTTKLKRVHAAPSGAPMYRFLIEYYDAPPFRGHISTKHIDMWRSSMINDEVKRFYVEPVMVEVKV